jgi:hypothetical protein
VFLIERRKGKEKGKTSKERKKRDVLQLVVTGSSPLDVLLCEPTGRVLLDELDEGLERPVALVIDEGVRAGGLELEGGEAGDLEGLGWREVVLL